MQLWSVVLINHAFVSNTEFYTVVDQLNKILDVLGLYYRLLSMIYSHKS